MAVHVRYKSLYISMPSSAQQQREMTKFCVFWRTGTTATNFLYFYLELNACITYILLEQVLRPIGTMNRSRQL